MLVSEFIKKYEYSSDQILESAALVAERRHMRAMQNGKSERDAANVAIRSLEEMLLLWFVKMHTVRSNFIVGLIKSYRKEI